MSYLKKEDVEHLHEKLKGKANVVCPMCKTAVFDVVQREAVLTFPETTDNGLLFGNLNFRKCFVNICSNCGFLLLFDIDTLRK